MPPDSDCLSSSYSFWSSDSFSRCSSISSSSSASLEACAVFSFSTLAAALASAATRFLSAAIASLDSMTEGCNLSSSASSLIRSLSLALDWDRALEASFFACFSRPSFSVTTAWCSARDSWSSATADSRCCTSEWMWNSSHKKWLVLSAVRCWRRLWNRSASSFCSFSTLLSLLCSFVLLNAKIVLCSASSFALLAASYSSLSSALPLMFSNISTSCLGFFLAMVSTSP
mmetsp:Transcript_1005/g.2234  ORF Transcript_1005/g.2234 Transcript_1005/m.2234 type:complete len:229 (-) Transcript_1005:223-909(-)